MHDELHISSVFVTHDQEEALEVSDRIVLMNKGRIEQIGSPREIYNEPATSFAYGFIGTVNEFRGRVEGGYVRVGDDLLPHGRNDLSDGADVIAFARPHETEIVKGAGDPATVKVTLEAPANPNVRWVVQAVPGLTAGSDGEVLNVSSGPANLSFPANGKRTIIVTALPTGAYDPDERDDTRYPVSITIAP